jgi:subtilisin family serine protease
VLDTHALVPPVREIGGIGAFVIDMPTFSTVDLVKAFGGSKLFVWAEPDFIIRQAAEPNDDLYSEQWSLPKIRMPLAWDTSTGSRSVLVAVIDSGVLLSHPDLRNNLWRAPAAFTVKVGSTSITCNQGDRGYDTVTGSCNPVDDTGHGTHVAGIIGAEGNNTGFTAGINWAVTIMPLRFIGPLGTGCVSDAVDMLDFARQAVDFAGTKVRVVNMSWGLYGSTNALQSEIALLHSAPSDIILVGAAGNDRNDNDTNPFYPASYTTDVISVAATDSADAFSFQSNFGKTTVHLGAPGESILSTWNVNPFFMLGTGTSMAAAHVSGAAALMLSKCKPTADQAKQVLVSTVASVSGLGNTVSGGRLDVASALAKCISLYP